MKRRAIEIGKDAVIVLLLCSIVLLMRQLLPTSITDRAPAETLTAPAQAEITAAAAPLLISVRSEAGRATVQGSAGALDAAWAQWGSLLGQALETATAPADGAAVTQASFVSAMQRPGVYFRFGGAIPAAALGRWLGGDGGVDGSSGDWLLTADRSGVLLWMRGETCMRWRTELPADALEPLLAQVTPDGSRFALELPEAERGDADPLTFWPDGAVRVPSATWEDPCDSAWANALAASLAFNPYGAGTYTDPQGNTVFTETSRTCTVSADGRVTLQSTGDDAAVGTAADDTIAAKIETARALVEAVCGGVTGDARLYLADCEGAGSATVCRFRYVLEGREITPDAATVTFDGDRATALEATVRTIRLQTAQQTLMPVRAAAAISPHGSRPTVCYALGANGAVEAGWSAQ